MTSTFYTGDDAIVQNCWPGTGALCVLGPRLQDCGMIFNTIGEGILRRFHIFSNRNQCQLLLGTVHNQYF